MNISAAAVVTALKLTPDDLRSIAEDSALAAVPTEEEQRRILCRIRKRFGGELSPEVLGTVATLLSDKWQRDAASIRELLLDPDTCEEKLAEATGSVVIPASEPTASGSIVEERDEGSSPAQRKSSLPILILLSLLLLGIVLLSHLLRPARAREPQGRRKR